MFNLGPFELVAIFVVALLVFGPDKLPEMGKQVGKAVREFKKFQESMNTQVRDVLEPITGPIVPNGNVVGPQPTNIKGEIPTELPAGNGNVNVPKSATIQNPEETPAAGEEAAPQGSFGYYETPKQAEEPPPPAGPTDSESR
jgi:TatA/E family protein of Tat protein translocase